MTLTKNQRNALRRTSREGVYTTSPAIKNGNSERTFYSLLKKGLVEWNYQRLMLTDKGKEVLAKIGPRWES